MAPPTKISTLHQLRFVPALRTRGSSYHRQGRVDLHDLTETTASATVDGTRPYQVELRHYRDRQRVEMSCDCPHSLGALPCKHLWALLLAIDDIEADLVAYAAPEAETPTRKPSSPRSSPRGEQVAPASRQPPTPPRASLPTPPTPTIPAWQRRIEALLPRAVTDDAETPLLEFVVARRGQERDRPLAIAVRVRFRKQSGEPGAARAGRINRSQLHRASAAERRLIELLDRFRSQEYGLYGVSSDIELGMHFLVPAEDLGTVIGELGKVARVLRLPGPDEDGPQPIEVDQGPPFEFELVVRPGQPGQLLVAGCFSRGEQLLPLTSLDPIADHDAAITPHALHTLRCHGAAGLAEELRHRGPIELPADELPRLLGSLARLPGAAMFLRRLLTDLPTTRPEAQLLVTLPKSTAAPLPVELWFAYDAELLTGNDPRPVLAGTQGLRRRDADAERQAHTAVVGAGVALGPDGKGTLPRERLVAVTTALQAHGVRVLAAGKRLRAFGGGSSSVHSGIDWFELDGAVQFDGHDATLVELLEQSLRDDGLVELGDGSLGMLPEAWLRRLAMLRALGGDAVDGKLRVPSNRALLLDALLASQDQGEVQVDAKFAELRQRLASFQSLAPAMPPDGFTGTLRPYQQQGLAWLRFLQAIGLGGCLADDMGLGKTVQVLALLAGTRTATKARRGRARPAKRPSLLVAPRSVLANWQSEAARFAPGLRVLDFSQPGRWHDGIDEELAGSDLVLTTYALLRADASEFASRKIGFHYAILDEAQAIKNADSQGSKAARLLQAEHRLVLTGTPVENHLGDLWSLFEFLNPGMLGKLPAFRALLARDIDQDRLREHGALLQRTLRPVLLRRTKQQVLTDLPAKVEQTLWCELGQAQRRRYETLREHYRAELLAGPGELDQRQRFTVLEALLRLRQAACHEGLLPGRSAVTDSAKFDALLPQLEELAEAGHKALVFSQFTSLLDLLEPQLQQRGIAFERLDGTTRRRPERIARFQQDPACRVFLISLKAGGFGLNLTAASYVFVLDPWWNPAAEMQAIDRAHRIGQQRTVHAYRLVCRGTVEERVLELQQRKKVLCEAILGQERSVLQDLTRADLELLLG
jgi:hypothetical protein